MKLSKDIIRLLLLNIALPTIDVFTDIFFIIKLFANHCECWAGLLLTPVLINNIFIWQLWWMVDNRKRISWIPVLLFCYPQYLAARVICVLWKDEQRSLEKNNRTRESRLFVEIIGSTICMMLNTSLMVTFVSVAPVTGGPNVIFARAGYSDLILFFIAYFTSVITTSHHHLAINILNQYQFAFHEMKFDY